MIAERIRAVTEQIAETCARCGRDPADVGLVAVSKTHPACAILGAYGAGQLDFGENYAQELRDKTRELAESHASIRWHFVGQIQSNKAKYIAPHAYRVHALEQVRHAQALASRAKAPLRCLVSVNMAGEASKGGVPPEQALDRCRALQEVEGIEIVGLMTMPPPQTDPEANAPYFDQLATLAARGRERGLALRELSMGMSADYLVAIRYGATWVRVGTAIFGSRS